LFTVLFTDQSTDICGYSIFRNGKLFDYDSIILSEYYSGKDTISHAKRRMEFVKFIAKLIKKHDINLIVYEDIFHSPNPETVKKLTKIEASLEDLATIKNIPFEEYKASSWRSELPLKFTSKRPKREEIKKAVCEFIDATYPELKDEIEDVKEAVAIGLAWIKKQEEFQRLSDKQSKS